MRRRSPSEQRFRIKASLQCGSPAIRVTGAPGTADPMLHSAGGRFPVGWTLVPQLPRCE